MAKTVRYTGTSGVKVVSAADFKNVGVEDQNQIKVAGANLHRNADKLPREVEVSDAAADYLVANDDFELVEGPKAAASSGDDSGDEVIEGPSANNPTPSGGARRRS